MDSARHALFGIKAARWLIDSDEAFIGFLFRYARIRIGSVTRAKIIRRAFENLGLCAADFRLGCSCAKQGSIHAKPARSSAIGALGDSRNETLSNDVYEAVLLQ